MLSRPLLVLYLLFAAAQVLTAGEAKIVYSGSSTVFPYVVAAAEAYQQVNPRLQVDATPVGSTAGHRASLARECTINGSSRPITSKEIEAMAQAKLEFIEVPVAYDALSVVTNPRNPWLRDLSVAELRTIYGEGGPSTWKDVRPNFPDVRMTIMGAGDDSGTQDYWNEVIMGKGVKLRPEMVKQEDDHLLVQAITADVNSVAFMGLSYLIENPTAMRAVAVNDGKGPVVPSMESVLDGTYTRLSRPIFIYVRLEEARRQEVVDFITFILDNPKMIEQAGGVPLPATIRALAKKRLADRTTGSLFGGVVAGLSLPKAIGLEPSAPVAKKPEQAAAAPVPAPAQAPPAWAGPAKAQFHGEVERLRAAALDLTRRSLEDGVTLEELAARSAELQRQAAVLAEQFRTAPRNGSAGLSLAEALALSK